MATVKRWQLDRVIMSGSMLVAGGLLVCAAYLNTSSEVKLPGAAVDVGTAATSAAVLGIALPAAVRAAAAAKLAAPVADPIGAFEADLDARAQLEAGLSCHGRRGYDISGDAAFVWGLTWPVEDEVECCRACAAHRIKCAQPESRGTVFWRASVRGLDAKCGKPGGKLCNAFVFCPAGRCFSYTPHNHSRHEWCAPPVAAGVYPSRCVPVLTDTASSSALPALPSARSWLKHESNITHPIAHGPDFPPEMRAAPRKHWPWAVSNVTWPGPVPENVQWIAGLVEPKAEPVWVAPRMPTWFTKFCTGKFGPCTRTAMPPQQAAATTARQL
jgi:hypothetical protein